NGARSYQRHLSPQHVDELGEFIQARLPQEPPDAEYPWIFPIWKLAAVLQEALVEHRIPAKYVLGIDAHGPELQHSEPLAAQTGPHLPEDHRPRGIELDGDRDEREYWTEKDQPDERSDDVQNSLQYDLDDVELRNVEFEERPAQDIPSQRTATELIDRP